VLHRRSVLTHTDSPVYDSSPHTWTHTTPVDISPDPPYNAYAVDPSSGSTTKLWLFGEGAGQVCCIRLLYLLSAHLSRTNAQRVHGLMIPYPHTQGNSDSIYGSHDDHSTYGACCDLLLLLHLFYFIFFYF